MFLETIFIENFRSINGTFSFTSEMNFVCGDNAQGKTSLLEAIHLATRARSFRTLHLKELIRFHEEKARIQAHAQNPNCNPEKLEVYLTPKSKVLRINGKRLPEYAYIKHVPTIAITENEHRSLFSSAQTRRLFFDRILELFKEDYRKAANHYETLLKKKNAYLRELQETPELVSNQYLDILDEQLAHAAIPLYNARQWLFQALQKADSNENVLNLDLRYLPSPSSTPLDDAEKVCAAFQKERKREILFGYSLTGPHKDDFRIFQNKLDLQKFGSSGQQRSALYSLLLKTISAFHNEFNLFPLVIIDDFETFLDAQRIELFLSAMKNGPQTFISCLSTPQKGHTIHLEGGKQRLP